MPLTKSLPSLDFLPSVRAAHERRSTFAEQYRAIADEIRLAAEVIRRREFVVKAG